MVGVDALGDPHKNEERTAHITEKSQHISGFLSGEDEARSRPPSLREVAAEGRQKEFGCYFWRSGNAMLS